MTITVHVAWWAIPVAVSALAILWALCWPARDSGMFGGIVRLFMLVPALFVIALAWAIAGILK